MSNARYTTLLFDLDHTLFDSEASALGAFDDALGSVGIAEPDAHRAAFVEINLAMWADVEAGKITPNDVRYGRFERLVDTAHIDADPVELGDRYVEGLGRHGDLYPGVTDVLNALTDLTLAAVTNGIGQVQRARIERTGLGGYFDAIVISGEVGSAKPGNAIFDIVFERLRHPDKTATLMIGDSLTSDMQGGHDYGIDTCWLDAHGTVSPNGIVTHRIERLEDLTTVVFGA